MIMTAVFLVGILGSFLQLAPSTHASDSTTVTMSVTCDGGMLVYVDGNYRLYNNVWSEASTVTLDSVPALVAIWCQAKNNRSGILAHFSDGQVTDARWRCTNQLGLNWNKPEFNDDHWPNAHEIIQYPGGSWGNNVVGMTGSPYWIWTTGWEGEDIDVFCRRIIKDCTQTVAGNCSKTCGVGVRSITSVCGAEHSDVEEYCCDGPCTHSGPGNGTGSGGGTGAGTHPPSNVSISATCDSKMELYVNGVLHAESEIWQESSTVHLGCPPAVVAIKCETSLGTVGILAHFSNGEVTDDTWKCSNTYEDRWNQISFNDDSWTDATELQQFPNGLWGNNVSGMTGNPYWISTSGNSMDQIVYCRKTIGADARRLCRKYPPFRDA